MSKRHYRNSSYSQVFEEPVHSCNIKNKVIVWEDIMNELAFKHGYLTKKLTTFFESCFCNCVHILKPIKNKGDKNDTITINNAISIFGFYINWRRFM